MRTQPNDLMTEAYAEGRKDQSEDDAAIRAVLVEALTNMQFAATLNDAKHFAARALAQWKNSLSPGNVAEQIRAVLYSGTNGSFISAIKLHRELTGSTLKNAKDYCDRAIATAEGTK